jgi:uncharacterized protein
MPSSKTAKTVSERSPLYGLRFFDASALVKPYAVEPESARLRKLLGAGGVIVSRLSEVEVASALNRRFREGLLETKRRDEIAAAFAADCATWNVVELTESVSARAVDLLRRHRLRGGDAIQLASALVARDRLGLSAFEFVAFDRALIEVAEHERMTIRVV